MRHFGSLGSALHKKQFWGKRWLRKRAVQNPCFVVFSFWEHEEEERESNETRKRGTSISQNSEHEENEGRFFEGCGIIVSRADDPASLIGTSKKWLKPLFYIVKRDASCCFMGARPVV